MPAHIARALRAGGALLASTTLVLAGVLTVSAQVPVGPAGQRPEVVDDELLVKFRPGTPAASQAAAHQQANGSVVREIQGVDVKVVKVGRGQAHQRFVAYQRNPNIELVEFNGIAYPDWVPNDALYAQQWALTNGAADADIDAPQAWNVARGSAAATISIVDTGIRADHPDLLGKVTESRNWYDGGSVADVHGHGTHVAGIAALRARLPRRCCRVQ